MSTRENMAMGVAPGTSPTRVLVVDDEEPIRVALGRGLRRLGCEVLDASGAEAGLAQLTASRPAVVFLDLRMPGVDGHGFLRRLHGMDSDAAVVVMSGQGGMDDVVEVLRAGAVDYLKKPWSAAEMMAAFTRAVERHEQLVERRRLGGGVGAEPTVAAGGGATGGGGVRDLAAPVSPFQQLLSRVREGDLPVPAMPGVLLSVRAMVRDPFADIDAIVAKIERDQRLAADLVRVSNSAHYARGGRNSSVKAAVTRLGMRQVHGLIETVFLKGMFPAQTVAVRRLLGAVWSQSVARAIAMRALGDLLANDQRVNADTAYLLGLLMDVGATFLLWVSGQRGGELAAHDEDGLVACVRKYHEELSGLILSRWEFEPDMVSPARHHHADTPPNLDAPYWAMSVVAGRLSEQITGIEDPTRGTLTSGLLVDRCAAELRIAYAAVERLIPTLRAEYMSISETLA